MVEYPTQSELKELLEYNPYTGVFAWKVRKGRILAGTKAGYIKHCYAGKSYHIISINGTKCLSHILAWIFVHGEKPEEEIDHKDGNGTNNRINNLRIVSHQDNQRNRRLQINNSSGYNGVSFHKSSKKWEAQIKINGKSKYLGCFYSLIDAIAARKAADKKWGFHENHGSNRPL